MLTLLLLALAGGSEVALSARLDAAELAPGSAHEITLDFALPAGLANANPKIAPILQIDVPAGVVLEGRVVKGYEELAANEFLQEPFERALGEFPARIAFRLDAAPAPGAKLGLNVIAYLVDEAGQHSFLRRRLELPLEAGARAREGDAANSNWSGSPELLRIGQRAADFDLPREDGSRVALSDFVGEREIIITTYRAYW